MRRRQLLANGAALFAATIAGCAHPSVVLNMDAASAVDVAEKVATDPEAGSDEYAVVEAAVENGSATRNGEYDLFDHHIVVQHDSSFYEISETKRESSEVTVYEVRLDIGSRNATAELGEIAYADLPAVDRRNLEGAFPERSTSTSDRSDVRVEYGTAEGVGNESVFVPEPEYDVVVHDGNRYRVGVDYHTRSETAYRYEATEIADSTDAFGDRIREQYLFVLTGLGEAERTVVEEAIDSGYYDDTDAFRSVVDRIHQHEAIEEDDFYGTWLVEYDGEEYLTYVEW